MYSKTKIVTMGLSAVLAATVLLSGIACSGETSPDQERETEWQFVTAKSGLRLRSAPSTEGTKLALIPPGARVAVLERSESMLKIDDIEAPWVRVRHNGLEGWVFGGYLGGESAGGDARQSSEGAHVGIWLSKNLCDGVRSRLVIKGDGTFEAFLFGGCDVTGCLCGPAKGEYRIDDGRLCFSVTSRQYPIVRSDARADQTCYKIDGERLVAVSERDAFYENYGSEIFTNLTRSTREELEAMDGETNVARDHSSADQSGEADEQGQQH